MVKPRKPASKPTASKFSYLSSPSPSLKSSPPASESPSSKMPLLPELWLIVMKDLYQPRPEPLSRPSRSKMRQQDMYSAMRVCKLFYEICQPILYTEIHTDQFPLMLQNITNPATQRRFACTKSLHIEYSEMRPDPRYPAILLSGAAAVWDRIGCSAHDTSTYFTQQCERIPELFTAAFTNIRQVGERKVFPLLRSISISSIYGVEYDICHNYQESTEYDNSTIMCCDFFDYFLVSSGVKHICVRDSQGPLSFSPISRNRNHYARTLHFEYDVRALPLPTGSPLRYVSDIPMDNNWYDLLMRLEKCIRQARRTRQDIMGLRLPIQVDMYCSTTKSSPVPGPPPFQLDLRSCIDTQINPSLTIDAQRRVTSRVGKAIQSYLSLSSGLKDIFRCHPSADIATCIACGSGTPT